MENKTNDDKKQKDEYTHVPTAPGGILCGSKENTGLRSTRLLPPPATLAQETMQLTETCK